jgi:hypothetical protein
VIKSFSNKNLKKKNEDRLKKFLGEIPLDLRVIHAHVPTLLLQAGGRPPKNNLTLNLVNSIIMVDNSSTIILH